MKYSGVFLCVLFFSCSSFESLSASKEGWSSGIAPKGTAAAGTVTIDSVSLWDSLEKEISGILPLFFLEKGYVPASGDPDFTADIKVFEREYMEGWKARHSLSVEVRLWGRDTNLPLAAGRAMLEGNKSFASSKTTAKLLRLALSQALSSFEKTTQRNNKTK